MDNNREFKKELIKTVEDRERIDDWADLLEDLFPDDDD